MVLLDARLCGTWVADIEVLLMYANGFRGIISD